MKRTVIIGLDGVPYDMISRFAREGIMPNTARIIGDGIFKKTESTIPEVSSTAWSSMITGKNPAQHGIFGFMDMKPGTYDLTFPNYVHLKASAFWHDWPGKSVIINVPATYPSRPMNGIHIAGFVAIDINKSVYPKDLVGELGSLDYRLDVDSQKAHQNMDAFIEDLEQTLEARIRTYRTLWDRIDWQTFMLVFTGTDRLMHFLYDAYENPATRFHQDFINHFKRIDEAIGEIADKLGDDDLMVILSDHGFEKLEQDVYINRILFENNFLTFRPGKDHTFANIDFGTKAFALDPGRIYVNVKGKYPCGFVDPAKAKNVIFELEELLSKYKFERRKVFKGIYRKEEIFHGPLIDDAPDLTLVGARGFNIKAAPRAEKKFDRGIFTGKHTQDTAFMIIKGLKDKSALPERITVADIRGIMEKANGI